MLEIFRELRGLLRVSHVHIDSWVFRLHYSVTTTCLFAFSLIVSAKQYVGNPIDCIHSKDIPEEVLNTYCWIHSTYTIPSAFWKRIGFDVAHPGVDKTLDPEERRYHKYYQWVCFCLFFQVGRTYQFDSMRQVPLERDINIAVNGCSGIATSTQKGPFTAMLISRSRGTCLI